VLATAKHTAYSIHLTTSQNFSEKDMAFHISLGLAELHMIITTEQNTI